MLSIISNNPFRILGAYTNSSLRDIIANSGKIKAFTKVGKDISFEIDNIAKFNDKPNRSEEAVEAALAILQSDVDRPKYAIFWFNSLNVDFGTSKLIAGDMSGASAQFISTIESNDLNTIQDIIGDKSHSSSSSDIIKCYFDVICECDDAAKAISSAISVSSNSSNISFLSSLQKGNIVDDLKSIAEDIDSLAIENQSSTFSALKTRIREAKKIIADSDLSTDILLAGAYDQVCKSVRSKIIGISNNSFDNIGKIQKEDFINTIKQCVEVLKSVDTTFASEKTKSQYKEDLDSMTKDIKNIDDAYLIAIASNEEICWFCGEKASDSYEKKYEKKEEYPIDYNTKRVITYTKSAKFHVCKKCMLYHDLEMLFIVLGIIIVFIAETLIVGLFNDNWGDTIAVSLILQIFAWAITIYGGKALGEYIHQTTWGKLHLRNESDHPLVKIIKNEGFS